MTAIQRTLSRGASALSLALFLTLLIGCGGPPPSNPSAPTGNSGAPTKPAVAQVKKLTLGGATFISPMMDKWGAEYEKTKEIQINYGGGGSGAGVKEMIAGTFDFGCTDAPMTDEQLAAAKAKGGEVVHIPLAMGAVVPAYTLKDAGDKPLVFSGPVLADIYLGKIKKWNDPKIKELNDGVNLPNKDIAVAYRQEGSGTTFIFTEYLSKVSDDWKAGPGFSTSAKFPVGTAAKGNDGVTGFVKMNDGAIGYVELIYALSNDVKFGSVKNKDGNVVTGSTASVTAAAAASLKEIPDDLRYSITNAAGKDSYPISGTDWAVLYINQPAKKKQAIVDFLTWATHDGQKFCEDLHYAKLPAGLVERIEKKLATVQEK